MPSLIEELKARGTAGRVSNVAPSVVSRLDRGREDEEQATSPATASVTGQPKPGMLSSFLSGAANVGGAVLKGLAHAPARAAATAQVGAESGSAIAAALGYLAIGNQDAAEKVLREAATSTKKATTEGYDYGPLGKIKPVGMSGNAVKDIADVVGTGAELGTLIVPTFGGAAAGAGARSLGAAVKAGAAGGLLTGATSGALGGLGQGLQEADDFGDMWDVFKRTLGGAVIGGAVGGALGGVTGGGGYVAGKIKKGFVQGAQKARIQDKVYADKQEFINEKVSELSEAIRPSYGNPGPGAMNEPDEKQLRRLVEDALDMGLDQKDINMILKEASPEDIATMRAVFNTAKAQSKTNVPLRRTTDEVGESFMKPVEHLMGVQDRTGKQLGEFTRQMANAPKVVDATLDKKLMMRELQGQLGVQFRDQLDDAGKIVGQGIDFSESSIANNSKAQKLIKSVMEALPEDPTGRVKVTDLRLHRLRQQIFSDLQLGKQEGWLREQTPIILQNFRERAIWKIDDQVPGYADWSRAHAIVSDTLGDFWQKIGYNWQGKPKEYVEKRAGQIGQRLLMLQNAPYEELASRIDDVAAATGFDSEANLMLQSKFALQMNRLFGVAEDRGFEKSIQSAVERAGEGTFRETVETVGGGKAGVAQAVTRKFLKSQQVTKDQIIDVIGRLLSAAEIAARKGQEEAGEAAVGAVGTQAAQAVTSAVTGATSALPSNAASGVGEAIDASGGSAALAAPFKQGAADIVRQAERMVAQGKPVPKDVLEALADISDDAEVNATIQNRIRALITKLGLDTPPNLSNGPGAARMGSPEFSTSGLVKQDTVDDIMKGIRQGKEDISVSHGVSMADVNSWTEDVRKFASKFGYNVQLVDRTHALLRKMK